MSKLVVTTFMSMDGVVEAPENWSFPYWNDGIERFKNEELYASDAQLLGRKTYEIFAASWPARSCDYAKRLNRSDKYVVSTTLKQADWVNTTIVRGREQLQSEIAALKPRHAGDLLVHGSHSLVQALIAHDLVDEFHLLVYPLLLGQGRRLFEGQKAKLELVEARAMGSGVVLLVYRRPAP